MAVGPFSLWRPVDPDRLDAEPPPDTGLTATQQEVLGVYRALAMPGIHVVPKSTVVLTTRMPIPPSEAKRLELWVIAGLLYDGSEPEGMTYADFEAEAAARVREATPEQLADAAARAEALRLMVEGEPAV